MMAVSQEENNTIARLRQKLKKLKINSTAPVRDPLLQSKRKILPVEPYQYFPYPKKTRNPKTKLQTARKRTRLDPDRPPAANTGQKRRPCRPPKVTSTGTGWNLKSLYWTGFSLHFKTTTVLTVSDSNMIPCFKLSLKISFLAFLCSFLFHTFFTTHKILFQFAQLPVNGKRRRKKIQLKETELLDWRNSSKTQN